ncbi:histidine phosphatase family protein [Pseudoduganella chitinolytica]|uniref:Histidine phosphatase family protein n=1 Tax=Pseudoduganella chitinolytica TaxID=34070 RepID=A0ABY8BA05_9BURK|nr:histidine phosphatase family protein [Pseudoduganella chitinolytica]WEF32759.1 histidine phosphatase family protein [Pseudoduganella chitinolytica]
MALILIRHPRPLVADGTCYGGSDVPVAADELARVVQAVQPVLPAAPVFSSPLQRCALLARRLSDDVTFDADLAEMNFGSWEQRAWDDIARADVDAWAADLLHYRPGGGETVLEVAVRVRRALMALSSHGSAIVVCHAGTIRLMTALATGTALEQAALAAAATPHRIAYGAVVPLTLERGFGEAG